jgi:hypothetical protein
MHTEDWKAGHSPRFIRTVEWFLRNMPDPTPDQIAEAIFLAEESLPEWVK